MAAMLGVLEPRSAQRRLDVTLAERRGERAFLWPNRNSAEAVADCKPLYPSARGTHGMRATSMPSSASASACSGVDSP